MTPANLWLIPSFSGAESVSVIQRGGDLMLCEWRWPPPSWVWRKDPTSPPWPRSMPSQARRQHSQLSGELRDSDGSELIRLCCWCATLVLFLAMGGLSLGLSILCAYFNRSLCLCLSVSLFASESHSFLTFLSCHLAVAVVVVKVCCGPERLSPQFSMAESKRATLRSRRLDLQFETQRGVKCPLWAAAFRSQALQWKAAEVSVYVHSAVFHWFLSRGCQGVWYHCLCVLMPSAGVVRKRSRFTQSERFCLHGYYIVNSVALTLNLWDRIT